MNGILKVLKKIETSDMQSLHIEVPSEILKGLNIQSDGSVDLEALMQLCQRLMRVKKMKSKTEAAREALSSEWRDKIFK